MTTVEDNGLDVIEFMERAASWNWIMNHTVWKPQDHTAAEPVPLASLQPSHRRNLRRWIVRRASIIEFYYSSHEAVILPHWWEDVSDGIASASLDWDRERMQRGLDPAAWIVTTPFMVELDRLINEDRVNATKGQRY